MDFDETMVRLSVWILPLLLSITLHEAAHAYMAKALGDDTAYKLGRVTLNPLKHIDPVGTILVPLVLFMSGSPILIGWAKAVPVDTRNFLYPRRDMGHVALSGPLANMIIAAVSTVLIPVAGMLPDPLVFWATATLFVSINLNLVLAMFNLLPVPPLDGSKIAVWLLPEKWGTSFKQLEQYGMMPLVGLVFVLPMLGDAAGLDLDVVSRLVGVPAGAVADSLVAMVAD
jgi:Zn-dependent protease